jgi:lysophospholipase L1-like esterase
MARLLAASALVLSLPLLAADEPFAKWEKEVAAVEKANGTAAPGGVVFAGSSSVRLWNLKKSFPNDRYVNAGFGGSKIADCTHFAARLVTVHKPATVVFYAGDNDIGGGAKPEQVRDDFSAFVAAVHKDLPKCRVLFVSVKPSPKRWEKFETQKQANALVKAFCATDERLGYVDVVAPMLGADGKPMEELFVQDGLHMTPKGYEIWTAAVNRALGK